MDGSFVVSDAGSRNGTVVNGKSLDPGKWLQIQDGDRLFVGHIELLVRIGSRIELEHLLSALDDSATDSSVATHGLPEQEGSIQK